MERSSIDALYGGFADLVDLGAAVRTRTNCCRLSVLHRDRLRVLHFDLLLVLQAVAFQVVTVLIRDSDSGADLPILGVGLCPIQPQFKLNSLRTASKWVKSKLEGASNGWVAA